MALREELQVNGDTNIYVCTVEPDSHDTPFFAHAANYTGKKSNPLGSAHDPENVIDTIVELAEKPQDKVLVGSKANIAATAHRIAPKLVESQMGKKSHQNYFGQSESAPRSSNSVREPVQSGRDVYGGYSAKGKQRQAEHQPFSPGWAKYLGFALPTALLIAAVANRSRITRALSDEIGDQSSAA
ncbi:MAG: hypothetical protein NVS9B15_22510 [Acidobacteriaceae bacterium]